MKIISTDDKYIASTWGASIFLKAGEPKEVSHELGLLCLQEGCAEYTGGAAEEVPTEKPEVVEIVTPDLHSMTKIQLEEHGRTMGIELDRRKKKATLIEEIQAAQ